MIADADDWDDLPDVGEQGTIDPRDNRIEFREDPLSAARVRSLRPFRQDASDKQPIRIVRGEAGNLMVMEGNHRVYAARLDGLESIQVKICSLADWQAAYGPISRQPGNNNPGLRS